MSDPTTTGMKYPSMTRAPLTYEAALERVMGLADFERSILSPKHSTFHLDRMVLMMERLGNVHLRTPTVHIAGTKGKGSTAAMVTCILQAQGYKVGLYTSPHLHSAVERIRVGLEPITRKEFAVLVKRVWPAVQWVSRESGYDDVTTFEMLTAMAFVHFSQQEVDFQVIEVGLGGRLDSTNIVSPQVCAITSISLDHVRTLGTTVPQIAREKAGIIKDGVPVVVASQTGEAMAVFDEVARRKSAPLVDVARALSWRKTRTDRGGQAFEVAGLRNGYSLWTALLGDHQLENAGTAVATVETLADKGYALSRESVIRGLEAVKWSGRLEVLARRPALVVVDGAHNPYSMRRLVQALGEYFRFRRLLLVFGTLGGHSARGMLAELAELSPLVLAVRSRHPRSAPAPTIGEAASQMGLSVMLESEDIGKATRKALGMVRTGDLVLGTGSLSVAAEVIEELRGIEPELYPYLKRPSDPGVGLGV